MFLDIPAGNAFDKSALARDDLDQSFLLEHPERFPDGGPADAELFLQIDLRQLVPFLEDPFQDGIGQCIRKLSTAGRLEFDISELGFKLFHFLNPRHTISGW
jgi:hypothetical protein